MFMFKTQFDRGCLLVLGGARSGKSRTALDVCNSLEKRRIFLATAESLDQEMEERIRRHRTERGEGWLTVEEPIDLAERIREFDDVDTAILLDCLTLWLSNLYGKYGEDRRSIEQRIETLAGVLAGIRGALVIVSNEVGSGIVPDNPLSRAFRDQMGALNRRIAHLARKVIVVMAGLPLVLKDE